MSFKFKSVLIETFKSYTYPFAVYKLILLKVMYPENIVAEKLLPPERLVSKVISDNPP